MYALGDDDREGLGDAGRGGDVVVGTVADIGPEQIEEFVVIAGGQPHRSGRVLLRRVGVVRQPLEPVPVVVGRLVAEDRHPQFVRGVEDRQLSEQRAGESHRLLDLPGELDAGEALEGDRHRQQGHGLVGLGEPAQRDRAQRFQVLHRLGLRRQELQCGATGRETDADPAEVLVPGPAFPQAGAGRERPQVGRVGVVPQQRGPLVVGRLPGLYALLGEVAQIVPAFGAHAAASVRAGSADLGQRHADHGDAHHPGHHVHGRTAAADRVHQHHGACTQAHR